MDSASSSSMIGLETGAARVPLSCFLDAWQPIIIK
jgi:hypothetical protein